MFEIIGLLIGSLVMLTLAAAAGVVYAGITYAVLRERPKARLGLMLLGAAIPIVSAIYLWLCVAMLPGESVFGDISEPLPNGYHLQALGKMPDFATIETGDSFGSGDSILRVPQAIGRIGVVGPL